VLVVPSRKLAAATSAAVTGEWLARVVSAGRRKATADKKRLLINAPIVRDVELRKLKPKDKGKRMTPEDKDSLTKSLVVAEVNCTLVPQKWREGPEGSEMLRNEFVVEIVKSDKRGLYQCLVFQYPSHECPGTVWDISPRPSESFIHERAATDSTPSLDLRV
jgi:hypothetical protein